MEKLHSIAQYFLLTTAKLNEYSTQHLSTPVCNFLDLFVTCRPDRFIFPVSMLINTNTKRKKKEKKQGCWSNCAWLWPTLTGSPFTPACTLLDQPWHRNPERQSQWRFEVCRRTNATGSQSIPPPPKKKTREEVKDVACRNRQCRGQSSH